MLVDRDIGLAEHLVGETERGVLVTLTPIANVAIHAMNLYGLLGSNAQTYELRNDPEATAAVDPNIRQQLYGQDRYFGAGTLEIYSPTIEQIVSNQHYRSSPEPRLLRELAPAPFGDALARVWSDHYEHYWEARFGDLVGYA